MVQENFISLVFFLSVPEDCCNLPAVIRFSIWSVIWSFSPRFSLRSRRLALAATHVHHSTLNLEVLILLGANLQLKNGLPMCHVKLYVKFINRLVHILQLFDRLCSCLRIEARKVLLIDPYHALENFNVIVKQLQQVSKHPAQVIEVENIVLGDGTLFQ